MTKQYFMCDSLGHIFDHDDDEERFQESDREHGLEDEVWDGVRRKCYDPCTNVSTPTQTTASRFLWLNIETSEWSRGIRTLELQDLLQGLKPASLLLYSLLFVLHWQTYCGVLCIDFAVLWYLKCITFILSGILLDIKISFARETEVNDMKSKQTGVICDAWPLHIHKNLTLWAAEDQQRWSTDCFFFVIFIIIAHMYDSASDEHKLQVIHAPAFSIVNVFKMCSTLKESIICMFRELQ